MSIETAHMEVAKERFLELMASQPGSDAKTVAVVAISQADDFAQFYTQYGYKEPELVHESTLGKRQKTKGCKACFGSGGKPIDPCKVCHGEGRVSA